MKSLFRFKICVRVRIILVFGGLFVGNEEDGKGIIPGLLYSFPSSRNTTFPYPPLHQISQFTIHPNEIIQNKRTVFCFQRLHQWPSGSMRYHYNKKWTGYHLLCSSERVNPLASALVSSGILEGK